MALHTHLALGKKTKNAQALALGHRKGTRTGFRVDDLSMLPWAFRYLPTFLGTQKRDGKSAGNRRERKTSVELPGVERTAKKASTLSVSSVRAINSKMDYRKPVSLKR